MILMHFNFNVRSGVSPIATSNGPSVPTLDNEYRALME
jgi:hypothetical protein